MTKNIVGLAAFAIGIVLLIFGFSAVQSFSSDVSRLFAGHPTDQSIWLVLGGAVAVIGGLILAWQGTHRG